MEILFLLCFYYVPQMVLSQNVISLDTQLEQLAKENVLVSIDNIPGFDVKSTTVPIILRQYVRSSLKSMFRNSTSIKKQYKVPIWLPRNNVIANVTGMENNCSYSNYLTAIYEFTYENLPKGESICVRIDLISFSANKKLWN